MGFTIRQATTTEFDQGSEIRSFIEGLYQSPSGTPAPQPGGGIQFDYDELSPEDLEELIGEVSRANSPVGVYADIDSVKKGDHFVFSVTRLAEELKKYKPKGLLARFLGGRSGARAVFIETVVRFAGNPRGDYPIVTIWW